MSRLTPKPEVVRSLFALSGNQCAFPECNQVLISDKGTPIADICHIEAANKGGARYNPTADDEQRRSFENLMLLCPNHHREIDSNPEFTAERLKEIKKTHEDKFRDNQATLPNDVFEKLFASIQTQLSHLIDVSEDTNMMTYSIQSQIQELLRRVPSSPVEEDFFIAQLEFAKNLKKQGKYQTAIELLVDFKGKNWEKLNPQSQFKLVAHIGMSYLDIHDKPKAGEYLISIKNIPYESADSLATLCLGYAITDRHHEFDAAFEKAVAAGPDNINLWVAYIERHKKEQKADDLLSHIPGSIKESVPILFTIGNLIIDEGRQIEGIAVLKKALDNKEETVDRMSDTKALIATRIIQLLVNPFKYAYRNYTKGELDELEEAKRLFTEAWEFINHTELAKFKWHTILNRGVINKITGQHEQALSDFQRAYELTHEFLAFKNLLFMHIQMGHLALVEQLLSNPGFLRELNENEKFEMQTFKARLLFLQGKVQEAINIMAGLLDENDEKEYTEILIHIIAMCFEKDLIEMAAPWCEKMVVMFPTLSTGYIFTGYLWRKRRVREKAMENYVKGESLLTQTSSLSEIHELADGYMNFKEYEKAIPLFERLANKTVLNTFSKGLIYAYYHYGDLQAAFAIAENLYRQNPNNPFLVEIISNIYEETRQNDKAISTIEHFLPHASENMKDDFSYRLARLYSFINDWENTRKYALRVAHPETFSSADAFTLAHLLIKSGEFEKGMLIAYNTRTRFFDESDTHQKYMTICVNSERGVDELFPSIVRPETAVTIKTEKGQEKTFLLTNKNAKGEHVIKPTDPFARELIGKAKGESLTIDKSYNLSHTIAITSIIDIYTHAFRESMALFDTRFAGQQGITVIHGISEEPGAQFEQFIRTASLDRNVFERESYNLYNQRKATIGVLAHLLKKNMVMQWFALISSNDVSVISVTQNELPSADHALTNRTPLVLDLTSLLTIFFISAENNFFSQLENKFIVSESTLDELRECYQDLEGAANDGYLSVDYQDGRLVSHSISKETIQKHRETLQSIINWCRENCTIANPSKLLEIKREERKKMSKILGDCFYDTMLLAEEHQAAIVSDDDIFKHLFREEKFPAPFSTYALVNWLQQNKKVSVQEFDQFRMSLVTWNHIYIPLNADQLWECFDKSGYQLTKPFTVAVKGLIVMRQEFAIVYLTNFLKKLYLDSGLTTTRQNTVLLILRELTNRNDFSDFKKLLSLSIQKEFHFLPNFKDDLLQLLSTF